ncbi:DUF6879 family protein [Streptomyces sp. NPDC008317]|uniref:DUF6879 family protein n=1 Tax=Streptomyces sp. NPDC008317 TaxID=3364827 RepID=UPI0036E4A9EB
MSDLLDASHGVRLGLDAYRADFRRRDFAVDGCDSWKLERRQDFREPGDPSWNAFTQGDWEGALRLIEAQREELLDLSRLAASHGCRLLRVRAVEFPLTAYLRWELNLLRVRAECGELIRVIGPEHLAEYEHEGPVPELVTLNDDTVYEILYDADGVLEGLCGTSIGERGIVSRRGSKGCTRRGRTSARSSPARSPIARPRRVSEPREEVNSSLSGSARDVVQGRDIHGGIHFHAPATDRVSLPVPQQLPLAGAGFVDRHTERRALDRFVRRPAWLRPPGPGHVRAGP